MSKSNMRSNAPANELGHTEYPKWVGEGNSRCIVNDQFEEDAFNKANGSESEPEAAKANAPKATGWDSKKS